MNCYTIRLDENGHSVADKIELPIRRSAQGAHTWLGYPFVTQAREGCQNQGRHCTQMTLEEALITGNLPRPIGNHEDRLAIRTCSFDREKLRIGPAKAEQEGDALVLVQVSKIDAHFPRSRKQVGEGFLIEYEYIRPSRHPARVVKRKVEERLFRLARGESVVVMLRNPAVRVFGIAVHKGNERTFEITNTGNGITFKEIASTPLAVPDFEQKALVHELTGGLMSVVFGIVCGIIGAPVGATLLCSFIGLAVGFALFAVVELIRYILARCTVPFYTSLTPPSHGCCNSDS